MTTYRAIALVTFCAVLAVMAWAQGAVVVAVPAKAGAVDGKTENSDAFIWRLFTEFAAPASKTSPSPVVFETWVSDADTSPTSPSLAQAGRTIATAH